jgi:protein O-GlcNAc transferase
VTNQELMQQALTFHRTDQLAEAIRSYRTILDSEPSNANALHLLGMAVSQAGNPREGAKLIEQAVSRFPNVALFQLNLGATYHRMGEHYLAIATLKRAIELNPKDATAYQNLSAALGDTGQFDQAISAASTAIQLDYNLPAAHFNLGNALKGNKRTADAIAEYRRAIDLRPDYVDVFINLGTLFYQEEQFDEAIVACNTGLSCQPDSVALLNNLGACLEERGRLQEAIAAYTRALQLAPDDFRAHNNLAFALSRSGDFDRALAECHKAINLNPGDADVNHICGLVLYKVGRLDEALGYATRAVQIDPKLFNAHNTIGNIFKDMGRISEALACYRRAMECLPKKNPHFHSNYVYTRYFDTECTSVELLAEHATWAREHAEPLKSEIRPHDNDRDPDRRLRIGYVSGDLRNHPVGRFIYPLLMSHDHLNFEIFCYASVHLPDTLTARIQPLPDVWRDIRTLSEPEGADMIRHDRIDILVDLTMHMAGNRLPLFARKPAPLQVTYLAYAGTTGLETMDYRITDPYLDPPGSSQEFYTEKSIRLPRTYWCYHPPLANLGKSPLPAAAAGYITFGCLNNFCKITAETLSTWLQILAAVPESKLVISANEGSHRDVLIRRLAESKIDPDRVSFVKNLPMPEYMAQYQRIDIALDPFPYPGGTTTCDALWMGVPVVTLAGNTAISRGGVSILSNISHPELIAQSTEQYVRIAVDLAKDTQHLSELRSTLRDEMQSSPLMNAPQFARDMEAIYRQIWREYVS